MNGKGDGGTDQAFTYKQSKAKFLQQNFRRLPRLEQLFFQHGSLLIGANSAACGFMAYNLFRETLKIRKSYLSIWAVTATPFMLSHFLYDRTITSPLLQGTLACPICAMIRSDVIAAGVGCVAPVYLSCLFTISHVPRISEITIKKGLLSEAISLSRPVFQRLKYFFLFEVIVSTLISSQHMNTLENMLLMPPSDAKE